MRDSETKSRKFAKELRSNLTNAETILWSRLRRHPTFEFRRQHPIGSFVADFACVAVRLVIEIDGETHSTEAQREYDEARTSFLKRQNWRVIRVWNDDVYKSLHEVLDLIEAEARRSPPSVARAQQSSRIEQKIQRGGRGGCAGAAEQTRSMSYISANTATSARPLRPPR